MACAARESDHPATLRTIISLFARPFNLGCLVARTPAFSSSESSTSERRLLLAGRLLRWPSRQGSELTRDSGLLGSSPPLAGSDPALSVRLNPTELWVFLRLNPTERVRRSWESSLGVPGLLSPSSPSPTWKVTLIDAPPPCQGLQLLALLQGLWGWLPGLFGLPRVPAERGRKDLKPSFLKPRSSAAGRAIFPPSRERSAISGIGPCPWSWSLVLLLVLLLLLLICFSCSKSPFPLALDRALVGRCFSRKAFDTSATCRLRPDRGSSI
mmetsp:Transcript_95828/g.206862  ORF Transcript_95828/g.206862 Transcript_95828/m.206862 type:complete len:269 (-) Transcript_95828:75-881(-)